jgi:hypothetical protein
MALLAEPKNLYAIELVDGRPPIVEEVERKWNEAKPYTYEAEDRWVPSKAASKLPLASTRSPLTLLGGVGNFGTP